MKRWLALTPIIALLGIYVTEYTGNLLIGYALALSISALAYIILTGDKRRGSEKPENKRGD